MDLLIKVRDAKYRPVSELTPGIPVELEQIADKCLTRSRANRYQTAAEVEGDLRSFLRKYMPNYSRSHLGRFIRKSFAQEIERELRMLEEYVLTDDVSDDVGENLMGGDENFDAPEVPFQPKPTSVSIAALQSHSEIGSEIHSEIHDRDSLHSSSDFSGDSQFTTMPKAQPHEDIHGQKTLILENGPRRTTGPQPSQPPVAARPRQTRGRTQPPPIPAPRGSARQPVRPIYDEELHSAPTMIIDIGRMRSRNRG
jgi:serine/threonine protein kinase